MPFADKLVFSRPIDWIFLVFPVWLPASYLIFTSVFGGNKSLLAFFFLFFIGETHFVATLFFFTKENFPYIISKKVYFVYIPLGLLALNCTLFFWNYKFALILGGLMSAWHVTRQSVGVSRLYSGRKRFIENDIYVISLLSVLIGFLRSMDKYLNWSSREIDRFVQLINDKHIQKILFLCLLIYAISRILLHIGKLTHESAAIYLVGCFIYTPYIFLDPSHAAIIGVAMHWSQYLTLVSAVSYRNGNLAKIRERLASVRSALIIVAFILLVFLADFSRIVRNNFLPIMIIPLSMQLLHYYYDGLIWRGSDPYLRENIFKRIFVKSR